MLLALLFASLIAATVLLIVAFLNIAVARGLWDEWHNVTVKGEHGHLMYSTGTVMKHVHLIEVDEKGAVREGVGGEECAEGEEGGEGGGGGIFTRCCPKIFNIVDRSWKMYPIGFLFGLGFGKDEGEARAAGRRMWGWGGYFLLCITM